MATKPKVKLGFNQAPYGYWLNNFAWNDMMIKADDWRTSTSATSPSWGTNQWSQMKVDGDKYPTSIPQNGLYAHLVTANKMYTGDYTLQWTGSGDVICAGETLVSSEANKKVYRVSTSQPGAFFNVMITKSDAGNPVKNIQLLLPGHVKKAINPDFVKHMVGSGVIRFMDATATNNSTHQNPSDRVTEGAIQGTSSDGSAGGMGGASYEHCCETANALGSHAWFCVPHMASDDYVRTMATVIRDRLSPSLHCYIEYSNETWNGGFRQTGWTQQQGQAQGLGSGWQAGINYCARRSAQIFKIFTQVFGSRDRLVCVIATQNGNGGITDAWVSAMKSSTINPLVNDAQAKADAIATAPYFRPKDGSVKAGMTPAQVIDLMRQELNNNSTDEAVPGMKKVKAAADANGWRCIAYEGGQHCFSGTGDQAACIAANRDAGMEALYNEYFSKWFSISDDVFCHFNDCFNFSNGNMWGLIEKQNQTPNGKMKSYQAVVKQQSGGVTPVPPDPTPIPPTPIPTGSTGTVTPSTVALSSVNVVLGSVLTGSVVLKNTSTNPITLQNVTIALRGPGATHGGGPYTDMTPSISNLVVPANGQLPVQATRQFVDTDILGTWEAYCAIQDSSGKWSDGPSVNFTVLKTAPVPPDPTPVPPTPNPTPGKVNLALGAATRTELDSALQKAYEQGYSEGYTKGFADGQKK